MWPFRQPIAAVYVRELRKGLDPLIVPVFTPDVDLAVGDVGSFEDGRFVRRSHVRQRGLEVELEETEVPPFVFASQGKVEVGPTVKADGLASATVRFKQGRAVVASFAAGAESTVTDPDAFAAELGGRWARNELNRDRAVIWSLRRVRGGTVMVSEQGGTSLDVSMDAALLGAAGITVPGLSLGASFASEHSGVWAMSAPGSPLVAWIRLYKPARGGGAQDAFPFDPSGAPPEAASEVREAGPDELLAQLPEPPD